jgi:hypothetical protein
VVTLDTVFVVSRCSAMITQDLSCGLLTLGARSTLPAAKDQFQKCSPQIRLRVTKFSVEAGRVDDGVTWKQPWDLMWLTWLCHVGRNSSVGIATRFGLGCPGIEYRWGGADFRHPSKTGLGPPVHWVPGLFSGG